MAKIKPIAVRITLETVHKRSRIIKTSRWFRGMKCPLCGFLREPCSIWDEAIKVCPSCGAVVEWSTVGIREVKVKTGFWFWQRKTRLEERR